MLRLVAMSCAALVLVIALGAAIKPLASGVLQAGDVLRFILLAIPPMLAYALPFAACFGATLAYHRFASDNETTAAYAGGVSHRSLLMPAVIVGLLLALVLGYLNEQVSPRYWRDMEKLGQGEIARLLAQEIEKGQPVPLENNRLWVYADSAVRLEPPRETGALDQVRFAKLAVMQLDETGKPTAEATAQSATLWVFPPELVGLSTLMEGDKPYALGSLELEGVIVADSAGLAGFREAARVDFRVPRFFREKPKYMTFHELSNARREPGSVPWVASARLRLERELALHAGLSALDKQLKEQGSITLRDDDNAQITIEARSFLNDSVPAGLSSDQSSEAVLPDGALALEPVPGVVPREGGSGYSPGIRVRMQPAPGVQGATTIAVGKSGWMEVAPGPAGSQVASIHLQNARVTDANTDLANALVRPLWNRSGVRIDAPTPAAQPIASVLSQADKLIEQDTGAKTKRVQTARKSLAETQATLLRELTAKRHERIAIAVSCFVMVLAGATTALRLSQRLPLTVYLWAFLPAIGCLVTISGGAQVIGASKTPWLGIAMLWSGVVALLVMVLVVLRKVARN